ncbi:MAG: hypothetical protein EB036_09200, partial [Betaproteobacteria bacterium]|nr:hypothetical protein [Betaproteobacteria bacterium]
VLIAAVKRGLKPRDIVTRESIENAVTLIMATGGSTNAVLHYLAIAHSAGVNWTIDDFERIRKRVPVLCDLKPSGKYMAVDLHRAGGIPQVLKILLDAGLIHGDCMTITGKTLAEELANVSSKPAADQDVIFPIDQAIYAQGHLAILKGNLALEEAGVPNGPINTIHEAFEEAQVKARGIRFDLPHPIAGLVPQIASPMRFSDTTIKHEMPPPTLGQHTDAVLKDLGLSDLQIAALRAGGAI